MLCFKGDLDLFNDIIFNFFICNLALTIVLTLCRGLVPESQRSARNSQLCTLIVNIIIVVCIGLRLFSCLNCVQ